MMDRIMTATGLRCFMVIFILYHSYLFFPPRRKPDHERIEFGEVFVRSPAEHALGIQSFSRSKRKGRDSNSRYHFWYTVFPGLPIKPLLHPSALNGTVCLPDYRTLELFAVQERIQILQVAAVHHDGGYSLFLGEFSRNGIHRRVESGAPFLRNELSVRAPREFAEWFCVRVFRVVLVVNIRGLPSDNECLLRTSAGGGSAFGGEVVREDRGDVVR